MASDKLKFPQSKDLDATDLVDESDYLFLEPHHYTEIASHRQDVSERRERTDQEAAAETSSGENITTLPTAVTRTEEATTDALHEAGKVLLALSAALIWFYHGVRILCML
jgi:hypothetical protein